MRCVIFVLIIMVVPITAYATTLKVPSQYPTIQQAIDAAKGGDTVLVDPGTYVENIDFLGKAIAVKSTGGAGATIIDGGNPVNPQKGSVVSFINNEGPDSILDGFTITNGTGTRVFYMSCFGGGIYCLGSSPRIANNIITENTVGQMPWDDIAHGGGISCGGDTLIINNIISENVTIGDLRMGGGIFAGGTASIIDNTITGNSAHNPGGGGIFCEGANLVEGNMISENTAYQGGGLRCKADDAWPTVSNNIITLNSATERGGGIHSSKSGSFINNAITQNSAAYSGGGIHCYFSATIMNNLITGNSVSHTNGRGGGICCDTSSATITNNTLWNNAAACGGGISCEDESHPIVTSTILWSNSSPKGPEIAVLEYQSDLSSLTIRYSDVKGGSASAHVDPGCSLHWGDGMIDADPLFVDPPNGDFHLKQHPCQPGVTNPCVDTGGNLPGNLGMDLCCTRTDGVFDSDVVDMGFHYGLSSILPLMADLHQIPSTTGGAVQFTLNAGSENFGHPRRYYIILGSITGTSPGFLLPGGMVTMPLNWDWFTLITLQFTNTPVFENFMGQLSFYAHGSATLNVGPIPGGMSLSMHFAYALYNPWDYASNPVGIEIVP